jgi:hypothetical protein
MNFSTIALSKGYFFAPNIAKIEVENPTEFINKLGQLSPELIDLQAEVMKYGYMFDVESLAALISMSNNEVVDYSKSLSEYLAYTYGDGDFVSLFGNFPANVLMMSETEVFVHQIFHYLSGGAYVPAEFLSNESDIVLTKDHYSPCFRETYKLIKFADALTLGTLCKNMCNAQQSLTSYDKDVVKYFCQNYSMLGLDLADFLPEEIPFKETLCIVAKEVPAYTLKSATDVLRLAVYMSGGDISLPAIPKVIDYGWKKVKPDMAPYNFKKFKRSERKLILAKLNDVFNVCKAENVYADMKKYANKWIRLGEIVHPGEYSDAYPEAARAFYMIRDLKKYIETFHSRANNARLLGYKEYIKVLSERPGEFARAIDGVLRKNIENSSEIIESFKVAVKGISMKVLYELVEYYNNRNRQPEKRVIFVKSQDYRKAQVLPDLPEMPSDVVSEMINTLVGEIGNRFAAKDALGFDYVLDERLSNITLPKGMRNMNLSPGQLPRGSKMPIANNTGLLRLYCRWVDKKGDVDLDLSCGLYKENFDLDCMISWNRENRRRTQNNKCGVNAIFSGDVRHRVGNCAEYIDLDVESLRKDGVRYIVADVHDFDGNGFDKKDSWAGIMELESFGSVDKTWSPADISCGFKLASKCTNIVMAIVDLKEMVMYTVDEDRAGIPVSSSFSAKPIIDRYVNNRTYFSVLSLIKLNAEKRNANLVVADVDTFNTTKADVEKSLIELKELRNKYQNLLEEGTVIMDPYNTGNPTAESVTATLQDVDEKIASLEKIKFISYEDIATDYTSIFEWMF